MQMKICQRNKTLAKARRPIHGPVYEWKLNIVNIAHPPISLKVVHNSKQIFEKILCVTW